MTSSAAPSAATTTRTARTTRSRGSTGRTVDEELLRFTKDLIALRRRHPVFRRRRYSTGKGGRGPALVHPGGYRDDCRRLGDRTARSVALFINGATDPDVGADGTPMVDDDFLVLINAWWEPLTFTVPATSLRAGGVSSATPTTPHAVMPSAMNLRSGSGQWSSCTRRPET